MNEYNYDEKILDEEEKSIQEIELPAIVRNFEKVAISYSRYNNIPAIIGYYSIVGDLVKHMVEIPFKNTTVDTRIHFADIQTARSGKSTLINYVLKPVTEIIYEELEIDNKVLSVIDYTTPSLIGSHIENKKFDENAEQTLEKAQEVLNGKLRTIEENHQYNDEERVTRINHIMDELNKAQELYERNKQQYFIEFGPLHGEGIWFADEFEGSGIFKERQHKENIIILFQNMMNNFHIGANVYEKKLTGKPIISLDSKYTITGWTYLPEYLLKVIVQKGVLQRFLLYVWEVPDDILTKMRKSVLGGFGIVSDKKGPPLHLKDGIIEVYNLLEEKFISVGRDKLQTITYHPSAKDVLDMEHDNLLRYIDNLNPRIRAIIRLFEMNLMEYIGKLAVLNCISMAKSIKNPNERFIVHPQNVRQASYIVRKCYTSLISWLEEAIKIDRSSIAKKSGLKEFQQAYEVALNRANPQQTLEGGYVHKALVLDEAGKIMGQSHMSAYRKFNKLSEMFESKKKGRTTYIKPKEIEG